MKQPFIKSANNFIDNKNPENCPICGSFEFKIFALCDGLRIVKCLNCSLVYVNPLPSRDQYKIYFQNEYIASKERVEVDFGEWRVYSLRNEAKIIQREKPEGKILDIGCAGGQFLKLFEENKSYELHGVELSIFAAEQAKNVSGANIFNGTLSDAHYPDHSFDVITILDTLPFIPKPRDEIAEVCRILKPDGILGIEIPGYNFRMIKNKGLICRILYGKWCSLNPLEHLFYYSDITLKRLIAYAGFEVIDTVIERPPIYGNTFRKLVPISYFHWSKFIYELSARKLNLGAKLFYIAKKTGAISLKHER